MKSDFLDILPPKPIKQPKAKPATAWQKDLMKINKDIKKQEERLHVLNDLKKSHIRIFEITCSNCKEVNKICDLTLEIPQYYDDDPYNPYWYDEKDSGNVKCQVCKHVDAYRSYNGGAIIASMQQYFKSVSRSK